MIMNKSDFIGVYLMRGFKPLTKRVQEGLDGLRAGC